MKSIFKLFFASGFLLLLNSCVPIQELDESYNQMEQTYVTNIQNPNYVPYEPQINIIRAYYRAPDGVIYRRNDFYRDKYGKVYLNGFVVGQDNIYDHPGVIGQLDKNNTISNTGFLPPVDFDDPLQNNMSKTGNSNIPTKRSGSNSKTYPGSFNHSPRK